MKKYNIILLVALCSMCLLSATTARAEAGITIVSSTSAEQSHLLATIGRLEVSKHSISLISKEGECLATEPLDTALKIEFNTYSSTPYITDDAQQPTVWFSEQSDKLYVQGFDSSCVVRIFTLNGVLLMQQLLSQGCGEVDCSAIPAGYYILQAGTRVIKIYKR